MTTMETLQLALLNRTTRRRHQRELVRREWNETPYQPAEGDGSRALAWVLICAGGLWIGALVAVALCALN